MVKNTYNLVTLKSSVHLGDFNMVVTKGTRSVANSPKSIRTQVVCRRVDLPFYSMPYNKLDEYLGQLLDRWFGLSLSLDSPACVYPGVQSRKFN